MPLMLLAPSATLFTVGKITTLAAAGISLFGAGIQFIKKKIHNSKVNELFVIAENYYFGDNGSAQNFEIAKSYYEKIIDLDGKIAIAFFRLGSIYHYATGRILDFDKAKAYYEKTLALDDNAAIYFALGTLYDSSDNPDLEKAYQYYYQAAERNFPQAFEHLETFLFENPSSFGLKEYAFAELYQNKQQNNDKAILWYLKAKKLANEQAIIPLTKIAQDNKDQAFKIARIIEENNLFEFIDPYLFYAQAMLNQHQEAKKILMQAVENNLPCAQYALGSIFYHENKNYAEAVSLCLKAAAQGNQQAVDYLNNNSFPAHIYNKIAQAYIEGIEIKSDIKQAEKFYAKSSSLGNKIAAYELGELYKLAGNDQKAKECYIQAQQRKYNKAKFFSCDEKSKLHTETAASRGLSNKIFL